jgi:hypothetical protein
MKLAKVKVEYTGGTTITERVMLNPDTGHVQLPPRLHSLMNAMDGTECSPSFTLEYKGVVVPVERESDNSFKVTISPEADSGARQLLQAIASPTKEQRLQNGRFAHTLSAASIGGAVGYAHSTSGWDTQTLLGTLALGGLGVVLWYAGLYIMKGE